MHEARKATAADIDALASVMARAFEDDPLMCFLVPERGRLDRLTKFFASEMHRVHLGHDEMWTTRGLEGAALWAPPDKWRRSPREALASAPSTLRALGMRAFTALSVLNVIERAHPPGPHFYLAGLGTDPVHQGKGVASSVIAPALERCDREGLGAYLESSKEKNIAFYIRHGFNVTRELKLPKGGPSVWLMWRDPR